MCTRARVVRGKHHTLSCDPFTLQKISAEEVGLEQGFYRGVLSG
ncbi:MAG: hypothetical protein AAB514_03645 [Patescibacteria group bacterium]